LPRQFVEIGLLLHFLMDSKRLHPRADFVRINNRLADSYAADYGNCETDADVNPRTKPIHWFSRYSINFQFFFILAISLQHKPTTARLVEAGLCPKQFSCRPSQWPPNRHLGPKITV
jgi:hypothetical protein